MAQSIRCEGITTHNLKNIDIDFPIGLITAVTGPSGSGKSSLVYDTLYGESYRRYIESLSSYARQYLTKIVKAPFKKIANLPPSIALKQVRHFSNPRSTLASLTELDDFLRAIFAAHAQIVCPTCGKPVQITHAHQVFPSLPSELLGQKIAILAPLEFLTALDPEQIPQILSSQGFNRFWHPQQGFFTQTEMSPQQDELHDFFVVVDRIVLKENERFRFEEAVRLAFKIAKGKVSILCASTLHQFTNELRCLPCDTLFPSPSVALFSPDHPLGACTQCKGFGLEPELAMDKIIPEKSLSLETEGVAAWNFGSCRNWYELAIEAGKDVGVKASTPFTSYTAKQWEWLTQGNQEVFPGMVGFFSWLDTKSYKAHYRIHASKFKTYRTCSSCDGFGLNELSRCYKISGSHFGSLMSLNLRSLNAWLQDLKTHLIRSSSGESTLITLEDLLERVAITLELGLDYLSLSRKTRTMSGGEFQRACLARSLASGLSDTLYCLDEPTTGLHLLDSARLIKIIRRLRDLGNTIIVVEHDATVIKEADHIVCLGPKGGSEGGHIMYQGPSGGEAPISPPIPVQKTVLPPIKTQAAEQTWLTIKDSRLNNLCINEVRFPLNTLIGICGVSGSGKTSLIHGCLFNLLNKDGGDIALENSEDLGVLLRENFSPQTPISIQLIDQKPPARSSRSSVASYIGIWDWIRDIYARTPKAKALKIPKSYFSFNSPGGRCEACEGRGWTSEDLSFLGEIKQSCDICLGKRFSKSVLNVTYNGKNIADILDLTVNEAENFFVEEPNICAKISTARKLGLDYLILGQTTSALSGGEMQRLKLFTSLDITKEKDRTSKKILILDEPSVGLADSDLIPIFEVLAHLVKDLDYTVLIIEHNLLLLSQCQWLIELGPGSAEAGGKVVFQGSVAEAIESPHSRTGEFLIKI